ncbi:MAG: glutaredoxin family protein [Pseudohongiella sp.]|uniref:glutaredoxin family protein n=1 Tax=Pseudohongiella sp. TaxID=1979412 RepID=UPI0034A03B39
MAAELLLYTTVGCHLCEQAEAVLHAVADTHSGLTWRPVEISDAPALVAAYGLRIPVIRLSGQDADLGWPFDEAAVRRYLTQVQG